MLQAEEVARRLFGFGPFSDDAASVADREARTVVRERFSACEGNRDAFRAWLAQRIGVWLDYTSMPQRPLCLRNRIKPIPKERGVMQGTKH